MGSVTIRRTLAGAVVAAAVALVAGCGGSSSGSTASTAAGARSTATWTQVYTSPTATAPSSITLTPTTTMPTVTHSYGSAAALQSALSAAGLDCTGAHHIAYGGTSVPIDDAVCTLGGRPIQANIYRDASGLASAMLIMRTVSCMAAKANGITHIYYVNGDRSTVAMRTSATPAKVAAALHGQPGLAC